MAENNHKPKSESTQSPTSIPGMDLKPDYEGKLKQPIPHKCSNCRHKRRFERTNKPKFYDRKCDKCKIKIRTSYSPERPEIIYCEKCYQQEVY